MENSTLKERIIWEMKNLISESCVNQKSTSEFKNLHIAILKKHYNATHVSIDYHRRRVKMHLVMDDSYYNPQKVNTFLPTMPANLYYRNLDVFLESCIERDNKSLCFYASLLRKFAKKEIMLVPI